MDAGLVPKQASCEPSLPDKDLGGIAFDQAPQLPTG